MIKAQLRRIVVLPLLLMAAGAAHAAVLKTDVTVTAPVVTLGDVLTDAGTAGSVQIAPAPAPGERMLLSAAVIARLATDNGIDWQNPYNLTGVAITRAGKPVSHAAIAKSIGDAIRAEGDTGQKSIQLSATQGTLYVPVDAPDAVDVGNLNYDRATGMFTATVTVPSDGGRVASAVVTGHATDVISIPVLNRAVSRGDMITKSDIDWTDIPPSQAQGNVITDEKDLVGKAARRPLRPELPVRSGDVQEPILVGKNTLVTLIAGTPNLMLTTIGRTLDEGGAGDIVRVMNTQSHKIVQGVVISGNEVRVEISSRFASLNPGPGAGPVQH